MKLVIDDDITIFLGGDTMIDINDIDKVEKQMLKLLGNLNKKYDTNLYGYYNAFLYIDKNYGMIICLKKEDLEYLDYLNNSLELNVKIILDSFLYKVEDLFIIDRNLLDKFNVFKYKDCFYLEVKNKINGVLLGTVLEKAEIIFGKNAHNIKNKSQIVR